MQPQAHGAGVMFARSRGAAKQALKRAREVQPRPLGQHAPSVSKARHLFHVRPQPRHAVADNAPVVCRFKQLRCVTFSRLRPAAVLQPLAASLRAVASVALSRYRRNRRPSQMGPEASSGASSACGCLARAHRRPYTPFMNAAASQTHVARPRNAVSRDVVVD